MKRLALPAISLAALMASGIAFAQTAPEEQPAQDTQQKQDCSANPAAEGCPGAAQKQPDATDPAQTGQSEQPKDQTAEQPAPSTDATVSATTIDASKAVLATSFIGSSVYTSADENIGDINDIIFDEKGMIQAAIVGVGGFLGMGEKDVALPLDKITVTRDETNAIKLTVASTREELEQAPAFDKTLFLVKAAPAPDSSTTVTPQPATPGSDTTQQ